MASFHGQYEHSVDSKDRVTVPARWRGDLSKGVVLAKGLDSSVWVFTPDGYAEFSQGFLKQANPLAKDGLRLRRHFHGARFDDKVDSAGRIRLPKVLAEYAGVAEGPCMLVGSEDWFEVWNLEAWTAYEAETQQELDRMTSTNGKPGG